MNIKKITQAFKILESLTEGEKQMLGMLVNSTEAEREALILALQPEKPVVVKQERKIEHCAACDYTRRAAVHKDPSADGYHEFQSSAGGAKKAATKKSARASSLEQQIKANTAHVKDGSKLRSFYCYATVDDNGGEMTCGKPEDNPVHDLTYLSSHPFVRDARPASNPSSANGGAGSGTASSGTETASAGNAVREASGNA